MNVARPFKFCLAPFSGNGTKGSKCCLSIIVHRKLVLIDCWFNSDDDHVNQLHVNWSGQLCRQRRRYREDGLQDWTICLRCGLVCTKCTLKTIWTKHGTYKWLTHLFFGKKWLYLMLVFPWKTNDSGVDLLSFTKLPFSTVCRGTALE